MTEQINKGIQEWKDRAGYGQTSEMIPEMIPILEVHRRHPYLSYDFLRKCCLAGKIVHVRAGSKFLINYGRLVEWLNTSYGEGER